MNKERILEYLEGTPDNVYDTEAQVTWHWHDDQAICFGYFPISLDNNYEFMTGQTTHKMVAAQAAKKLMGKAVGVITERYENYLEWIENQCYDKSYGLGRYWDFNTPKYPNILVFWYLPSSVLVKEIVSKLRINPSKCVMVVEDSQWETDENITVLTYIERSLQGDENINEIISQPFKIDPKIGELIKSYNKPNETWQSRKEKEGWNTLAQRNHMIYQESKEPKKTINQENMKNNKHQEEFSNYINIMSEALKKDDYRAYEYTKAMLEEAIEESKHEKKLMNEMDTTNFGVLNHIFENELPTLIKNNKKAVKKVIKTIKEDKNLKSQFSFYNVIKEQYNNATTANSKEVLETLAKIVCENIDTKTIKASNKKLRDVLFESGVKPSSFVDEDSMKLYENGNVILTTKRNSDNTIALIESYDEVCKWMDKHKEEKKVGKDADEMIREFEEKLKENLTESELSFVQQITDFRTPIAEQRKEKLFNKLKEDCITAINEMLNEDGDNTELKALNEQLNEMQFNKNNIVKDIAKLLEIRDILMSD